MARLEYTSTYPQELRYRNTKLRQMLTEFIESGAPSAEVVVGDGEYKTTKSGANALAQGLHKMHCGTVKVKQFQGRIWLVRVDGD